MRRVLLILTVLALLLLCACGVKESYRNYEDEEDFDYEEERDEEVDDSDEDQDKEDAHRSDAGQIPDVLGEAVRSAWLDAIDDSGSTVQAPDLAEILTSVLDTNPDISGERLEEAILDALQSGTYQMVDLPESDGSDDAYLDALEVMLTELWIASLSELDLEPIQIDWGE